MKRVVIESPYGAKTPHEVRRNVRYLRCAISDCLIRGEAPYASHGLYTQLGVLDDSIVAQRSLGMKAGFKWGERGDLAVVYADLGISPGMEAGIARAEANGVPVGYRTLGKIWDDAEEQFLLHTDALAMDLRNLLKSRCKDETDRDALQGTLDAIDFVDVVTSFLSFVDV